MFNRHYRRLAAWLLTLAAPATTAAPSVSSLNAAWLSELSGLAASYAHPGFYWGHNDSGSRARLALIQADEQSVLSVALPNLLSLIHI